MKKFLPILFCACVCLMGYFAYPLPTQAVEISCTPTDPSPSVLCDATPTLPGNCVLQSESLMENSGVKMECQGNPAGFQCGSGVGSSAFICSNTSVQSAPPPSPQQPSPNSSTPPSQGSGNLTYVPLEPLPGVDQTGQANFADLIKGFFRLLVNVGAFVAVTVLVIGGITYMISEAAVTKLVAREKIKAAFWGLAILAGAWLILNTVNPELLTFNRDFLNPAQNSTTGGVQGQGGSGNAPNSAITVTGTGGITIYDLSTTQSQQALQKFINECSGSVAIQGQGTDSAGIYTEYTCVK